MDSDNYRVTIINDNPIEDVLASRGVELKRVGKSMMGKCPFHEDNNASMSVDVLKETWYCHACSFGGGVIDLLARLENKSASEWLREKYREKQKIEPKPKREPRQEKQEDKVYVYRNALGDPVFEVVRYKPKDFRQRHRDVNGEIVWGMDGVERVLYRLPELLAAQEIWILEGEKDVDNLAVLGYAATCNVGGAGKWLDSYTESLDGKDITICGDNDDAGRLHVNKVFESIAGRVKTARIIRLPDPFKDASDYLASFKGDHESAKICFDGLAGAAQVFHKGINLPIYTLAEIETRYQQQVHRLSETQLDLGKWLPGLRKHARGLVPGELVTIIADTGVGKSAIAQNIALAAQPLKTIFFELELPDTLLFERFVAIKSGLTCQNVERGYIDGDAVGEETLNKFGHLFICSESKMSAERLEMLINKSELKIGQRPQLVLVDYIGLMEGTGDRYQRISNIAESLKVIAKSTQTIIVITSQIRRRDSDAAEIFLHDAKDSGSIENSSGLVLGAWRDDKNSQKLKIKVLKNTKGCSGGIIDCNFNGETMRITELAKEPGQ